MTFIFRCFWLVREVGGYFPRQGPSQNFMKFIMKIRGSVESVKFMKIWGSEMNVSKIIEILKFLILAPEPGSIPSNPGTLLGAG